MSFRASLTPPTATAQGSYRQMLLRRFLQAYWLRPENAFWMTLRSEVLGRCMTERPSIDLGCGDGVFTFLHMGGVFSPEFDVFASVGKLDRVRGQHADMFDHFDDDYGPPIVTPSAQQVDVGTDLKATLLAKAGKLHIYQKLTGHDNNERLPFEDDSFQTAYCNCAYWVVKIDPFLKELRRITRPGGHVVLQVKLDSLWRYTLEGYRSVLGDRFLDIIGRGRAVTWPSVGDRATWEKRFVQAGLKVEQATPFVTRTHAYIWDVGLRPIAPLLVRMAQEISPSTRESIKREWVDLFIDLLEPFTNPTIDLFPGEDEPAEIQYVLGVE